MVRAGRPRAGAEIDEDEANHGKRQAEIAEAMDRSNLPARARAFTRVG
jgi:hypothetical protein